MLFFVGNKKRDEWKKEKRVIKGGGGEIYE